MILVYILVKMTMLVSTKALIEKMTRARAQMITNAKQDSDDSEDNHEGEDEERTRLKNEDDENEDIRGYII